MVHRHASPATTVSLVASSEGASRSLWGKGGSATLMSGNCGFKYDADTVIQPVPVTEQPV